MCLTTVLSQMLTIVYVLLISHAFLVSSSRHRQPRYQKLCRDSHIQIMSRMGAKIEPYERSRVEIYLASYTRAIHKNKLMVHFDFKTKSANGTLFYGVASGKRNDLVALTLRNGKPRYKIQCPTGHVDVPVPTSKPLNDNRWHKVKFDTRYGHHGEISINNISLPKLYHFGCYNITTLVMGGHNPDMDHNYDPELLGSSGHFEGCIRKLNLVHYLKSPPRYYAVSECD